MDDDRLASELERRASGASPRPDWASRDLLPAVWREIDARPAPVLVSRWSPLAGLATLVVALLVLVVALPRLVPAPPSATSSPATTSTPSAEPSSSPRPMSVTEFAARRATGDLAGKTVLVNGRIDPELRYGPVCLAIDQPCFMGVLSGADPPVDVSWRWVPSTAAQANRTYDYTRTGWQSWYQAPTPVEGVLLLSVTDAGQVDFVGRVHSPLHTLAWSVAGANELDINSLSPEQVVLVEGWLVDTEPPGSEVNIDCVPRQFPDLDGLPSRYCRLTDYLSSEQPTGEVAPDSAAGLQVQRAAAKQFRGPNADESAMYAIAPRLYGGGCSGAPPCRLWDVVARVDVATELATPTPSSSVSPSPSASPEPPPAALPCEGPGFLTSISDPTGLVAGCAISEPSAIASLGPDLPAVTNPGGDLSRLRLAWLTSGCATSATVSVVPNSSPPLFLISAPPSCILSNALLIGIDLALSSPVDANTIGVRFDEPAPQPTPSQPVQPSELRTIDCPDETTDAGPVQIEDHTGLVIGCSAGGAVAGDEPAVTSSFPSELTVKWMAPCVVDPLNTRIELWYREPKGDPSDPSRFQPPYLLVVNRSHPTEPYACLDAISGRQARIQLEQPISPADVALFFTYDGIGADSAQAGDGANRFHLEIAADQPEYVEGESIAVTASLLSVADATVTGLVHPMLGVEQLDGVIRYGPPAIILICPRPTDLTGGVPLEESTPWPTSWSRVDPQSGFLDAYVRDGELILPTGTYRFYALSSFSIGETCSGDQVELEASIVVAVR